MKITIVSQIKLLTFFFYILGETSESYQLIICFIQYLSLNFHLFLDLSFCMGVAPLVARAQREIFQVEEVS